MYKLSARSLAACYRSAANFSSAIVCDIGLQERFFFRMAPVLSWDGKCIRGINTSRQSMPREGACEHFEMAPDVFQTSCASSRSRFAAPEWATPNVVFLGWPTRRDVWRCGDENRFGRDKLAGPARAAMAALARAVCKYAKVCILSTFEHGAYDDAVREFSNDAPSIVVRCIQMDDCWIRDTGPIFVKQSITSENSTPSMRQSLMTVSFDFNAWGGHVDGCYSDFENDRLVGRALSKCIGLECLRSNLVLEGGSITCDGRGTVITTAECLLDGYRNPNVDAQQIESELRDKLGARVVIWLPFGAARDSDTNGHVDNMCIFVGPAAVILHWSEEADDPEQHSRSIAALEVLEKSVDADGNSIRVYKVHAPRTAIVRSAQEAAGIQSVTGSSSIGDSFAKQRLPGEQVAASYVNLLMLGNTVIVPQFGASAADDARALEEVANATGSGATRVVGVDAREFVLAGGGIHCLSLAKPEVIN